MCLRAKSRMETILNQIPEPLEEFAKAGKDDFLLGRTILAEAGHRRKNLRHHGTGLTDSSVPERRLDKFAGRLALEMLLLYDAFELQLALPAHIFLPLNIHRRYIRSK